MGSDNSEKHGGGEDRIFMVTMTIAGHTAPADHTILQTLHEDNIEQGDDPTREKDNVQKGGLSQNF